MRQKSYFIIGIIAAIIVVGIVISINIKQQKQPADLSKADLSKFDLSKVLVSDKNFTRDRYTLNNIWIEGNVLKLNISYGGGCKTHLFGLVWSGTFLESYPVQVNMFLAHDSQEDVCEALASETLQFDLTPLKEAYQKSYGRIDKIIINFRDFDNNGQSMIYEP